MPRCSQILSQIPQLLVSLCTSLKGGESGSAQKPAQTSPGLKYKFQNFGTNNISISLYDIQSKED